MCNDRLSCWTKCSQNTTSTKPRVKVVAAEASEASDLAIAVAARNLVSASLQTTRVPPQVFFSFFLFFYFHPYLYPFHLILIYFPFFFSIPLVCFRLSWWKSKKRGKTRQIQRKKEKIAKKKISYTHSSLTSRYTHGRSLHP